MIHMNSASGVILSAPETFGRDGAMFESLLGFVAQLSLVLWALVLLTTVLRSFGIRVYRRSAGRASAVETLEPRSAMAVDSGLTRLGLLETPATENAGSVNAKEALHDRRPEPRRATHVPAFAVRSEA